MARSSFDRDVSVHIRGTPGHGEPERDPVYQAAALLLAETAHRLDVEVLGQGYTPSLVHAVDAIVADVRHQADLVGNVPPDVLSRIQLHATLVPWFREININATITPRDRRPRHGR